MPNRYPAEVFWSDDDEGFIAIARDLPGCSAFGETRLEALDEFDHAVEAWIAAATKAGNPVPKPSVRQVEPRHSGKILLRIPKTLHSKLAEEAEREAVSLNQYVVWRLTENTCSHAFGVAATEMLSRAVRVVAQSNGLQAGAYKQHTVGAEPEKIIFMAWTGLRSVGPAIQNLNIFGGSQLVEGGHAVGDPV